MIHKWPVATVKEEQQEVGSMGVWESGSLAPEKLFRPHPLDCQKLPFGAWENVAVIIDLCTLTEN